MKLKSRAFSSGIMLLTSAGASAAECPPGSSLHVVDGAKKCLLDSNVVVVIDPEWLVASGVVLVLLLITTAYLAVKVGRLANGLKAGSRIG
jgi:hypothetical protein